MFKENLLLALESLRANKMRAFLTMLGIIIGIASVIGIISVGNSLSNSIKNQMQGMGTNNFMLNVREKGTQGEDNRTKRPGEQGMATPEDGDLITPEMIEAFESRYNDKIEAVSLSESVGTGKVKDGRLYANVSVSGVNPGYAKVNNVEMLEGRFLNDSDIAGRKSVAIVSDKLAKNIFGDGESPIGKEVKFFAADGIKTYIVIGTYKYKESAMFGASTSSEKDIQTSLYIPISLAKQDKTIQNYSNLTVMSKSNIDANEFKSNIQSFFAKYYDKNPKWEPSVFSMSSQIETVSTMLSTISTAIAVIAAISLLVGGIGVMNIMLVSVTERTKEIGTRKALGARNFHIRMQFITEAMIISLIGGLIGLILGLVAGMIGSKLIGAAATFSIPTIIFTVLFSMGIGVFFGYYPANKAAKLDPIDALRYE